MSQQKVDKYKKDKANRKKIIAKQKRIAFFEKTVAVIVGLALVAFIGGSAYFKWFHKEKSSNSKETVTYALSEKEISSIWEASTAESQEETTAPTESQEVSSSEEVSSDESVSDDETSSDESDSDNETTSDEADSDNKTTSDNSDSDNDTSSDEDEE